MVHPHNFGSTVRIFLNILYNEKGRKVDESNNNGSYQKKIYSGQMAHYNSGQALRIF